MKTPTPTEVEMSALDKRHSTPRPNYQGVIARQLKTRPPNTPSETRLESPPRADQLAIGRMDSSCCHFGDPADGDAEMTPHLLYSHIDGINVAEYHIDIGKLIICNETGCHGIRVDFFGLIQLGVELINLGRRLQKTVEGGST